MLQVFNIGMNNMKILFVLPTKGGGGGAHSVAQEANELARFGAEVIIAVNDSNAAQFATTYADMQNVCQSIRSYNDPISLAKLISSVDLVVCTIFTTVATVMEALGELTGVCPRLAYYIQDYEPLFSPMDDPLRDEAYRSYSLLPNALLYAKTDWICDTVTRNHGVAVEKVQPSLDSDIYFPGVRGRGETVRVSAMVRPATPRRAPRRTMTVLKELSARWGTGVSIDVFGCSEEDIAYHQLPSDFNFNLHGVLSRKQVGALFRESDVFLDLSDYQAFGRTGLESMACGCMPVLPIFGGTDEYGRDKFNSRLVDTRSIDEIVKSFEWYMALSDAGRRSIHRNAVNTSLQYSVRNAAVSELMLFERCLAA